MSASPDPLVARLDALQAQHEQVLRKNGRMEFAHEIAQWAFKHAAEIPPHLRAELAELIVRAGQ